MSGQKQEPETLGLGMSGSDSSILPVFHCLLGALAGSRMEPATASGDMGIPGGSLTCYTTMPDPRICFLVTCHLVFDNLSPRFLTVSHTLYLSCSLSLKNISGNHLLSPLTSGIYDFPHGDLGRLEPT